MCADSKSATRRGGRSERRAIRTKPAFDMLLIFIQNCCHRDDG